MICLHESRMLFSPLVYVIMCVSFPRFFYIQYCPFPLISNDDRSLPQSMMMDPLLIKLLPLTKSPSYAGPNPLDLLSLHVIVHPCPFVQLQVKSFPSTFSKSSLLHLNRNGWESSYGIDKRVKLRFIRKGLMS